MVPALFFRHFAAEPEFNMAFDEWLFARARACPGSLLLRLYSWKEGAITLGVHQQADKALDYSALGETKVIRRITGGRAVFHDVSEITYAVAVNPKGAGMEQFAGSVAATSAILAEALQTFLSAIDVPTVRARPDPARNLRPDFLHKAPCFVSAAKNELLNKGQKIVASAQRQIGGVLLQHGSIKISGLASHPALSALLGNPATQPLAKERFDDLAELFCSQMGRALENTFEAADEAFERDHLLQNYLERVHREPLANRENF